MKKNRASTTLRRVTGDRATWLRWYGRHVRYVLGAAWVYLRDGDEVALDRRVDVSLERSPFARAVKAATLAAYLIGRALRALTPAIRRVAEAAAELHAAIE